MLYAILNSLPFSNFDWLITENQQKCYTCLCSFSWTFPHLFSIAATFKKIFDAVCVHFYVFVCTRCTQYMCISMCIFSGARAYSTCPYLHLYIRTCMFVCQLDLNFSVECVSFVSVHLYAYECVWWWDLVVLSPSFSKNVERWRVGRGGFNQACVKIARRLSWSSRDRERQQSAEEKKDVCSYAHQQEEGGDEGWEREGIGRGEEDGWRRSAKVKLDVKVLR